jgi:hypothetical protein
MQIPSIKKERRIFLLMDGILTPVYGPRVKPGVTYSRKFPAE